MLSPALSTLATTNASPQTMASAITATEELEQLLARACSPASATIKKALSNCCYLIHRQFMSTVDVGHTRRPWFKIMSSSKSNGRTLESKIHSTGESNTAVTEWDIVLSFLIVFSFPREWTFKSTVMIRVNPGQEAHTLTPIRAMPVSEGVTGPPIRYSIRLLNNAGAVEVLHLIFRDSTILCRRFVSRKYNFADIHLSGTRHKPQILTFSTLNEKTKLQPLICVKICRRVMMVHT